MSSTLPIICVLPSGESAQLPKKLADNSEFNRLCVELIRKIAVETAQAIQSGAYRQFDALVKNFGCQITGLDLFQTFQADQTALLGEAARVQADPVGTRISLLFAQLMRYRLLSIVNDNKEVNGREVPFTNLKPLQAKAPGLPNKILATLIMDVQIEESKQAARFIQLEAGNISGERAGLINRMLTNTFREISKTGIVSLPLLYNTEACLRIIQGYVLVKNKIKLCGEPIPDQQAIRFFFKFPESKQVPEEEIKNMCKRTPLYVIEGYMKQPKILESKIHELGLIAIVNADAAKCPQYAGSAKQIEDSEAAADISQAGKTDLRDVFEIDHMFCTSIGEEFS